MLPIPSWALPAGPKASSAEAVTATREPTVAPLMAVEERRELLVDGDQLGGGVLVVGAERLRLGEAVADPEVRQDLVALLELRAVAGRRASRP